MPLSPQSLCIIHRKALCAVVQNSGGDVIVAASMARDCHLGWIHATGESAPFVQLCWGCQQLQHGMMMMMTVIARDWKCNIFNKTIIKFKS